MTFSMIVWNQNIEKKAKLYYNATDRYCKVCLFSFRRSFWKTNKKNWGSRKRTSRCSHKSKWKTSEFNKDDKNWSHKEIFEELVRERFGTYDKNFFDDLIYYFKVDSTRRRFNHFKSGIKVLKK